MLFEDYEVKLHIQALFSITFMLSLSMFELIIFEIVDVLSPDTRWLNWQFDIYVMLILLIFVLPFYMFYLVVSYYVSPQPLRFGLATILFSAWMYLFYLVGSPFPIVSDKAQTSGLLTIEHGVSRIGVIGSFAIVYGSVARVAERRIVGSGAEEKGKLNCLGFHVRVRACRSSVCG